MNSPTLELSKALVASGLRLAGAPHGSWPCDCWLDGKPAHIGFPPDGTGFALVRDLATGLGCEWSIEAARRIMNRDRKFKSM